MKKPSITKAQAAAIESIKKEIESVSGGMWTLSGVIEYRRKGLEFFDEREAAGELTMDDFVLALTVGYEVEKSVEDVLAEVKCELAKLESYLDGRVLHYRSQFILADGGSYWESYTEGKKDAFESAMRQVQRLRSKVGAF